MVVQAVQEPDGGVCGDPGPGPGGLRQLHRLVHPETSTTCQIFFIFAKSFAGS